MATIIKGEADASPPSIEAHDSINVALPSRISGDSFSRRGLSPGRHSTASPSSIPRSVNHRPSPIILPPKRLSEYEEFERGSNPRSGSHPGSNANTPNSSVLLERKRSFPFEMDTRSSDGDDEPHPSTRCAPMASPSSADVSQSDTICFCVKAPKIPRPRNAFILYRQHFQSQVVAENPGLANPDISKIIGGMWKGQTEKDREYWKGLAEQEKQHHRKQHPDYRYQPRRTGKGDARGAGRPGSANGDGVFDKGVGGSSDGLGDPNRCEKCGGRYIAPLPSARAAPMSARALNQPLSPYTSGSRRSGPQSAFPSIQGGEGGDEHLGRGIPSPRMLKQMPASQQRDQSGRRPLPQHGRPIQQVDGPDDSYDHRSVSSSSSDQKRRRYDPPNPYAPRFDTNGNHIATPIHPHSQYRLPQRSHRQASSTPPLSAGLPQYVNGGPGPVPGSPWMAPPPVPHRMSARGSYPSQPTPRGQNFPSESRHPEESEGYNGMTGRLPPIQEPSYGYHAGPGNGLTTPSTAMAALSMRQPPTPIAATPMSARPPMSAIGANNSRRDQFPHRPSSFSDESLRLPPLMTNVSTPMSALVQKHQQQQQQQQQQNQNQKPQNMQRPSAEPAQPGRLQSMLLASELAKNGNGISAKIVQDMPDKDIQDSGTRAMVLSIPYLVRLEYLRRMNPPQSITTDTKRGPIISIEGHNQTLTDNVGRIVEQALRQSGECHFGVWSTSAPTKKQSTDSGVGSTIDDGSGDGIGSSSMEINDEDLLAEYQALVVSWRAKTKAIVRHINTPRTVSIPAESIEKDEPGLTEASASAPLSPTQPKSNPLFAQPSPHSSMTPEVEGEAKKKDSGPPILTKNKGTSPASSSASISTSPRQSPLMPGSTLAAIPPSFQAGQPLIPIALITGGYSLSISDRYAMKVPIEDSYTPLDHWEWMAMMWRATAAPDLVIYVDCEPVEGDAADEQPSVNTRAQEGVIVIHASKAAAAAEAEADNEHGDGKDKDWINKRVLDKKTERRLTFEVMEWVRSFGYGA